MGEMQPIRTFRTAAIFASRAVSHAGHDVQSLGGPPRPGRHKIQDASSLALSERATTQARKPWAFATRRSPQRITFVIAGTPRSV
jgi:hypothetical protein